MTSLLICDLSDFIPSGTLCFYKEKVESEVAIMMPTTHPNSLWYIQHLILQSEYDYDDEEFDNPLDEEEWLLQTRGNYMKFVIYHSSTATEPRNTSNPKLDSF